ncbi:MAG: hypothetical protein HY775_12035 [Acidobacteria bacterium]|nr:hypothetical protein [Acidobacteriota bacterium]
MRRVAAAALVAAWVMQPGIPARADSPRYAWSVVSKTDPPAAMHPGEKIALTVVLRNDGSETWSSDEMAADHPVRLGASSPRDRSSAFGSDDPTWLWSGGRRVRMETPVVGPGAEGVFAFTFTAPAPGGYPAAFQEHFAPVAEGIEWMDSHEVVFATTVKPVAGAIPALPNPAGPTPPPLPTPAPLPTPPCDPADPAGCLPPPNPPPAPACAPNLFAPDYRDVLPPAAAAGYRFGTPAFEGSVAAPRAVARDPLGKLLIADTGNNRVLRVDPESGAVLFSWGGEGGAPGQFRAPSGIAASDSGRIFVSDTGNDRIQMFSLGGAYLGGFGSAGGAPGQLASPRGLAVMPDGNLLVADTGNNRLQVLTPAGQPVAVIGAPGTAPGELAVPAAVSVYGDRIYVADTGNDRVQRFTLAGAVDAVWGGSGSAPGCLSAPAGILAGALGVFVSDSGGNRIQHFTRSGLPVEWWGSEGSAQGQMRGPAGLALDEAGTLWVAEEAGNRLQRFRARAEAAPPVPCGSDPIACAPGLG